MAFRRGYTLNVYTVTRKCPLDTKYYKFNIGRLTPQSFPIRWLLTYNYFVCGFKFCLCALNKINE